MSKLALGIFGLLLTTSAIAETYVCDIYRKPKPGVAYLTEEGELRIRRLSENRGQVSFYWDDQYDEGPLGFQQHKSLGKVRVTRKALSIGSATDFNGDNLKGTVTFKTHPQYSDVSKLTYLDEKNQVVEKNFVCSIEN